VFVEDCSDDVGYDDEEVDFDSAEKDYEGGSKFFSTLVFAATPGLSASPVVTQSTSCPPCVEAALAAVSALSTPKTPMDATVLLTATASTSPEPPPSTWHHLFKSNRDTTRCPKLLHYSALTKTRGCILDDDDMDSKCDFWKLCLVGYIAGRSPGFKAIQNLITTTWHCEASLTIHASGWLIFKFTNEADKLNVLAGGPYLVYGRPLILRAMPEYFEFSSSDMHTIPVWVKFPNLPLKCWSIKCLSKIASVLGKPVQSDMLTSTMSRLSYARVLVEVNLLSDLPYSVEVSLPNGSLLHQQVVYETLPRFCKHCKILGHLTSTCTKFSPPIVPAQQQTPAPDPAPTGRDSVFHRLGPQVGNPVVDRSEASLLDDCVPPPKQGDVELVSQKEADVAAPGGWEIVNRRKLKHKPTPSQPSTVPPHTEPCSAQGAAAHMPQCDHLLPPPRLVPSTTSVPTSVIAGSRADKGKSVVVSGASRHFTSCPKGLPLRREAQQRSGNVPNRGEGLLSTPPP